MKPALVRRLERILVLIPFVARHAHGVTEAEAIRFAGYPDAEALHADLELARQIALPPEAPDDFIDISTENGRIQISLPQGFKKPPRLTLSEVAALLAAAKPLEASSGKTLASALKKLRRALPENAESELEPLERAAVIDAPPAPPCREPLETAIAQRREVLVDYLSASSGRSAVRRLEPREVFVHKGRWYLAAWVPEQSEEHLFRLDRMIDVRLGTRTFAAHKGPDPRRYDRELLYIDSGAERDVTVRFSADIAPLVEERWGEMAQAQPDGSLKLTMRASGENYVVSWVLAYGGEALVEAPAEVRAAMRERVERLRGVYRP
ncbi:MAG: helix-turn-helix transcriptional regulator [Myxococcales bacterium]